MAERPVIGVTGAHGRFSPSWLCTRIAVRLAGGDPLRISIRQPGMPERLDAVIIGGGDDIDPALYGGEGPAQNARRDALEIRYIHYALDNRLPLLGICRGAQLLNTVLGGSLYSNIRKLRRRTSNRRQLLPLKTVHLAPGSRISQITGRQRLWVNSLHYQAIKRIGAALTVTGRDIDHFVQAVEAEPHAARSQHPRPLDTPGDDDEKLPIHDQKLTLPGNRWPTNMVGVQWHPEYLWYLPSQLALFRWLVNASRHG